MSEAPADDPKLVPIVALGASAGGLRPLETFFEGMADDTGAAFVVIQHLSPDFESMMEQLLSRRTRMPVVQATDGMKIAANHVFLIPRRKEMRLADGQLWLSDRPGSGTEPNMPIDVFFNSMARAQGTRAIAVLLSGAGSDGASGIRTVHDAGGLVAVQAPETAQFDLMPKAAIATGDADEVLDPEQLPLWVGEKIKVVLERPVDLNPGFLLDPDALQIIARLLRQRHGVDFSAYKRPTLGRRIERRISETRCANIEDYAAMLSLDEGELDRLFRDLLIGVSAFFRDREAFDALAEQVVPAIFHERSPDDPVRVWVAGCSTGEEAYSIAMLLHEAAQRVRFPVDSIKVFATDVHPGYLARAGKGDYRPEQLGPVPVAVRDRYFLYDDNSGRFMVRSSLRSTIVFARHDLLHDPPFTRIDLVSCRNVLIYLRTPAQHRVIERLRSSLVPGGWMFLGPSESIGPIERMFEVVDRRERLYRARGNTSLSFGGDPPSTPGPPVGRPVKWASTVDGPGHIQFVYQQVLDRFVPACVLLDANLHVVHVFGDAARFLEVGRGRVGLDVLRIVRAPLRGALSAALHRSRELDRPVVHRAVSTGDEERPLIDIRVERLPGHRGQERRYTVVGFVEAVLPAAEIEVPEVSESDKGFAELRAELDFTREHLSATTEELTASNEELQATNEELLAANEELQSTNEELHSVNEELYTVNSEFRRKNTELAQLNIDVDNLLKSSDIGAVFLDGELRVRKYTPAAGRLFNLLPHDIDRPLAHLASTLSGDGLLKRVRGVLESGEEWSDERTVEDGRVMLLRCLPYRDSDEAVQGVVITFTDVTPIAEALTAQQLSERRLRLFAEHVPLVMWLRDSVSGRFLFASRSFERIWGCPVDDLETLPARRRARVHPDDRPLFEQHADKMAGGHIGEVEYRIQRDDGTQRWLRTRGFPISDDREAGTFGGVTEDITEARRHTELVEGLRREKERLASLRDVVLGATDDAIAMFDRAGALAFANPAFLRLIGFEALPDPPVSFDALLPDTEAGGLHYTVAQVLRTNRARRGETRARFPSRLSTFDYAANPVRDDRWRVTYVVLVLRDLGDRVGLTPQTRYEQLRLAVDEARELLQSRLESGAQDDVARAALQRLDESLDHGFEVGEGPIDLSTLAWTVEALVERGLPSSTRLVTLTPPSGVRVEANGPDTQRLLSMLVEHALAEVGGRRPSKVRLSTGFGTPPPDIARNSRPVLSETEAAMAFVEVSDDGAGRERGLIRGVLAGTDKESDPQFERIAELVVELGGAVELRSLLGTGTSRRVWLPLAEADAPRSATASRWPPLVLVADDAEDVRSEATDELGGRYAFVEAGDGLTTLRHFRTAQARVEAVVLDVAMPGPSARAIFRELRALAPRIPVLLLSAYEEDLEEAAIPVDDKCVILMKPWTPGAMRAAVDEMLGSGRGEAV